MVNSCFVEKLGHYLSLDPYELSLVAELEKQERQFRRNHEVVSENDPLDHLFIVKSGWLYNYADMADGRRQITRVMLPGDLIGFPDIAFHHFSTSLRAVEDVVLCPFPKQKLDILLTNAPRITALLWSLCNREMACLIDSIRVLGRMNAEERLSFFLLDMLSRLRVTNKSITNTIRMPLNQQEIGDHLGLTHTYVSKSLRRMEDDGLIARHEQKVTLLKPDTMVELTGFVDRYHDMDTSWFPQTVSTTSG